MEDHQLKSAEKFGHGPIKAILHTATILHPGWEMDNEGWIVQFEDGHVAALTTSHGRLYPWTMDEALGNLKTAEASAASIRQALGMWPELSKSQAKSTT